MTDHIFFLPIICGVITFFFVLIIAFFFLEKKKRKGFKRKNRGAQRRNISSRRKFQRQKRFSRRKYKQLYDKMLPRVAMIGVLLFCVAHLTNAGSYFNNADTNYTQNTSSTRKNTPHRRTSQKILSCYNPYIIDGDTLTCNKRRIRLSSIDAPEMPGHCRKNRRCVTGDPYAAKTYLKKLSRGRVKCYPIETDHYGRIVARCKAHGKDFSCAMIAAGHAIERYGKLSCP